MIARDLWLNNDGAHGGDQAVRLSMLKRPGSGQFLREVWVVP